VKGERLFHRVLEAGQGESSFVRPRVAAAVTAIDHFIGREEEAKPGEVVIEIEERKIEPGDTRKPDADKPVGDVIQRPGETNNLLVELGAVRSRLTSQDDEQRLAGALRLGPGGGIVRVPSSRLRVPLLGKYWGGHNQGSENS